MASQSKGKSSKTVIERPGISWRNPSVEGSSQILSAVKEAQLAPIAELKKAACFALLIFKTTQIAKENKEAYERLGYDSGGIIIAIWRSFKEAKNPEEWLSPEMRDILEDLSHTLENIGLFITGELLKSKGIRAMFSRPDVVKVNEYREHLNYVMQKFELQSQMIINDVLIRVPEKNDEISEQMLHRNEEDEVEHTLEIKAREARDREIAEKLQEEEWKVSESEQLKRVEINRQIEDALKKVKKESKERKSELERLRAAIRLTEAEEEIARLKQALADEDFMSMRSAKGRMARRNLSSASLRVQEIEDDYTNADEEDDCASSSLRKSPMVKRKPQPSSGALPRDVGDLMAQAQGFMSLMGLGRSGSGSNSRSGSQYILDGDSNRYFPRYGGSFSSPIRPYGHGFGMPGMVVNAGVGNTVNSTISNVGNVNRPRSRVGNQD